MSIRVMTEVWERSPLKGSALLLLLAIADCANDDGVAWPGVALLAKKLRMSERNTRYILKVLQETKAIEVERNAGPRGCNLFRVQPLQAEAGSQEGVKPVATAPAKAFAAEPSRTTIEPSVKKDSGAADVPAWVPANAWTAFIDMRKKIRAPLTEHGKELLIRKLGNLKDSGEDVSAVLEQSIERSWRSVFPVKGAAPAPRQGKMNQHDHRAGISADGRF